jgi:apolipoprotein N-acyltransferase
MTNALQGTTLKAELRIIPAIGWVLAALLVLFWFLVPMPWFLGTVKPKPSEPPIELLAAFLGFAGLVLGIWMLMVAYVSADAKRRQMNRLLWTLMVIFIPNAIGFIIYFVLRQPIARPCPKCRTPVRPEFVFCPACGQELAAKCPGCKRAVEAGWAACAFCGARLS